MFPITSPSLSVIVPPIFGTCPFTSIFNSPVSQFKFPPSITVHILGLNSSFKFLFAIAISTASKYNSLLLSTLLFFVSFIIFNIIGVAISAIIASITITANNSIRVKALFFSMHLPPQIVSYFHLIPSFL